MAPMKAEKTVWRLEEGRAETKEGEREGWPAGRPDSRVAAGRTLI